MIVTFMPHNIQAPCFKGDLLMDVAAKANIAIEVGCARRGVCGSCRVRVMSGGKVNEPEATERERLSHKELAEGWRLGCRLRIYGDTVVFVPDASGVSIRKRFLSRIPEDFKHEKIVKKYCVTVAAPTIENQRDDLTRLNDALGRNGELRMNISELKKLPDLLRSGENKITCIERSGEIISIEQGDTTECCYGVSFDIGTTTIVGMLWELTTGELVDVAAVTNAQSAYGADVISRINFASESAENLDTVRAKVIECLNGIISSFATHTRPEEIYEATVVGNTTMNHLFLGINPAHMARSPFVPAFCGGISTKAHEVELNINRNANVYLLPNIAGHVGSDIVAVMLASRLIKLNGVNIVIDIGTNGEILLCKNRDIKACSTAAGPAFEGSSIHHGMRAAQGAIEKVLIDSEEIILEIIDSDVPVGICGSGLVDAVAEMLRTGVIDYKGRFAHEESGLAPWLLSRIRKKDGGMEFVLAYREGTEDIVITQKDIRELQLAKGAVYAGIKILMDIQGVEEKDISNIYVAGAFGNYINRDSALRIGLFPSVAPERIISIGNAAGAGAAMALMSDTERFRAETEAKFVEHVELSIYPDFQEEFIDSLFFGSEETEQE